MKKHTVMIAKVLMPFFPAFFVCLCLAPCGLTADRDVFVVILSNASSCIFVEPEIVGKYLLLSRSFLTLSFLANTSFAPISNMIRVSAPTSSAVHLSMLDCSCVVAMSMSVDDGVMQRPSPGQRSRRVVRIRA